LSTCLQPLRSVSVISRGRSRVRLASNIEFVDKFKNETRNYMPEHVVNGKEDEQAQNLVSTETEEINKAGQHEPASE
jgi:hypothetical protein